MIRKSWTGFASIETTLELWASSLRDVKGRMRPLFAQERSAVNAGLFLDGLLSEERRKTGWMRAEAAGDIPAHGASRRCWGGTDGMPMTFAIWCATMSSNIWRTTMRCW